MPKFMASLRQPRQYLLNLMGKNVTTVKDTAAINSTLTFPAEVSPNTPGELSLKLTILCFLTTFGPCLADPVLIERLFHPSRFYNLDPFDATSNLQMMLTTSLGCSTVQILVHCFHVLRTRGILDPKNKVTHDGKFTFGNMLGTAFYPAHHAKYRTRGDVSSVGNGFWTRVLELIPYSKVHSKFDYELLESNRLKLRAISNYDKHRSNSKAYIVYEKGRDYKKYSEDIAVSEFPAITFIFFYGAFGKKQPGFLIFTFALLYPIFVKLFFAFLAVGRKTFHVLNAESANNTDVFEVQFSASRLSFIEGEHALVHRFFEYYGQPIRNVLIERILMVALALLLGPLPFVVAFFALSTKHYAYPWLAHQAFVLFGWYIARLLNLNSCGRTEERIAKALYKGKNVIFVNADSTSALEVTLQTTFVTPKPVTVPTLVSAKPIPVPEADNNDDSQTAGTVTPLSDISSTEIVDVAAESLGELIEITEIKAPTTPSAIVSLPNADKNADSTT
jgi:hypothetical protein